MSKSSILGFQQMGQQVEQANQSSHQHYRGQNVAPTFAGDGAFLQLGQSSLRTLAPRALIRRNHVPR